MPQRPLTQAEVKGLNQEIIDADIPLDLHGLRGKRKLAVQLMPLKGCIVTTVCQALQIGRATYYRWLEKDPDFALAIEEAKEATVDWAESKLITKVSAGDISAIRTFLAAKGKARGYGQQDMRRVNVNLNADADEDVAKKVNDDFRKVFPDGPQDFNPTAPPGLDVPTFPTPPVPVPD